MPIRVTLVSEGKTLALPDPSGDVFDAAGDFDRLLPMENQLPVQDAPNLRALGRIEAYADVEFSSSEMVEVAQEAATLLRLAMPGPEARGLERLRVLAEHGAPDARICPSRRRRLIERSSEWPPLSAA